MDNPRPPASDAAQLATLLHSWTVAFFLPAAQWFLRGVGAAAAVGALGLVVVSPRSIWSWMALALGVTLGGGIWWALRVWDSYVSAVVWIVQQQAAPLTPPPAPERPSIKVEVPRDNGGVTFADLPASVTQLVTFAQGLQMGRPLSEREWTTGRQKVFGQTQWAALIDILLRRELIEWVDPDAHQQGMELTEAGTRLMNHLARMGTPLPSPAGGWRA